MLRCIGLLIGKLVIFENRDTVFSEGSPMDSDFQNAALLVLDIQEGITGSLSNNSYYKTPSNHFILLCNRIMQPFDAKHIPVVYIKNEVSKAWVNMLNSSMKKGSEAAALNKRLDVIGAYMISKERQNAFSHPKLNWMELIVCIVQYVGH